MAALPEQETQQQAMNQLVILMSISNLVAPIHLSPEKSVNLKHVARYEIIEQFQDETIGEGKAQKTEQVPYDPRRYQAALFYGDSLEGDWLTESENAVFRTAWQRHARLTGMAYSLLDGMFGPPAAEAVQQEGQLS